MQALRQLRRPRRVSASLALAALCSALPSCASALKQHREMTVKDLPIDELWRACIDTARTSFRIDPSKVDFGRRVLTTRWRNDLAAFSRGRRRRAYFEVLPGDEERSHRVRYYVELQRYADLTSPFEPKEEEWKDAGQDHALEMRLFRHLQLRVDAAKGVRPRSPGRVPVGDPLRRR